MRRLVSHSVSCSPSYVMNNIYHFIAVTIALGSLTIWHGKLIRRGETSIEYHINMSETKRLAALGKTYTNPYNFGPRKNFMLFLGLVKGRTWRHILLPSTHTPDSDGLTWHTVQDASTLFQNDWP